MGLFIQVTMANYGFIRLGNNILIWDPWHFRELKIRNCVRITKDDGIS